MQTLPKLSIKCKNSEEPLTLEYDRDAIVLYDRSIKRATTLTWVEEALLSLIMDKQERVDAVCSADYGIGERIFGYDKKPTVSGQTDAEKIADNCRHPKLADMLFYLIRTDKESQRWWDGLSAQHQKHLVDCGVCHHMGIQDPNLGSAVSKYPEKEAEIQNAKLGKAVTSGFLPVMTENPTLQTLAKEIAHHFATNVGGGWWDYMHEDQQNTILAGVVDTLKKAIA